MPTSQAGRPERHARRRRSAPRRSGSRNSSSVEQRPAAWRCARPFDGGARRAGGVERQASTLVQLAASRPGRAAGVRRASSSASSASRRRPAAAHDAFAHARRWRTRTPRSPRAASSALRTHLARAADRQAGRAAAGEVLHAQVERDARGTAISGAAGGSSTRLHQRHAELLDAEARRDACTRRRLASPRWQGAAHRSDLVGAELGARRDRPRALGDRRARPRRAAARSARRCRRAGSTSAGRPLRRRDRRRSRAGVWRRSTCFMCTVSPARNSVRSNTVCDDGAAVARRTSGSWKRQGSMPSSQLECTKVRSSPLRAVTKRPSSRLSARSAAVVEVGRPWSSGRRSRAAPGRPAMGARPCASVRPLQSAARAVVDGRRARRPPAARRRASSPRPAIARRPHLKCTERLVTSAAVGHVHRLRLVEQRGAEPRRSRARRRRSRGRRAECRSPRSPPRRSAWAGRTAAGSPARGRRRAKTEVLALGGGHAAQPGQDVGVAVGGTGDLPCTHSTPAASRTTSSICAAPGLEVAERHRQRRVGLRLDDAEARGELGERREGVGLDGQREARGVRRRAAGVVAQVGRAPRGAAPPPRETGPRSSARTPTAVGRHRSAATTAGRRADQRTRRAWSKGPDAENSTVIGETGMQPAFLCSRSQSTRTMKGSRTLKCSDWS